VKARNAVEWSVLAVSVLGILVLVVVLVVEGLGESRPADPQVELRTSEARQASLGWIVPASVTNAGDEAAEAVMLEATAEIAGEAEVSEIEVNFLPAGSAVEIAFSFSAQPTGEVTVRLVGFRQP
jgi:uncharacterized protein (TIGR02588 family)